MNTHAFLTRQLDVYILELLVFLSTIIQPWVGEGGFPAITEQRKVYYHLKYVHHQQENVICHG